MYFNYQRRFRKVKLCQKSKKENTRKPENVAVANEGFKSIREANNNIIDKLAETS